MDEFSDIWCDAFTTHIKLVGVTMNYIHIKRTSFEKISEKFFKQWLKTDV